MNDLRTLPNFHNLKQAFSCVEFNQERGFMKILVKLLLSVLLMSSVLFVGCSTEEDDDDERKSAKVLATVSVLSASLPDGTVYQVTAVEQNNECKAKDVTVTLHITNYPTTDDRTNGTNGITSTHTVDMGNISAGSTKIVESTYPPVENAIYHTLNDLSVDIGSCD
jgi:major membrane immunogen (membrane-anchored lipoprotein)